MTLITKNAGTEVSDEKLTYASNIIKKLGCKDPKPGAAVAPPDHSYNSTNSPLQFAKQPENKEMDGYAPSARPAAPRAPAAEHEEPDGGPHYKDQEDLSRPAAVEHEYAEPETLLGNTGGHIGANPATSTGGYEHLAGGGRPAASASAWPRPAAGEYSVLQRSQYDHLQAERPAEPLAFLQLWN